MHTNGQDDTEKLRQGTCARTNVINRTICTSKKKEGTRSVITGDWHYILNLIKKNKSNENIFDKHFYKLNLI